MHDANESLIQYKQFIRIYNSLNIGEKISTNGKASTLKSHIDIIVPGFNHLLFLADKQLEKNYSELRNLSRQDQDKPTEQDVSKSKESQVVVEGPPNRNSGPNRNSATNL
jgi:hypothetical protein